MSTTVAPPPTPPSAPAPPRPMPVPPPPTIKQKGLVPPPTAAFQGACWAAFAIGAVTFLFAVWYAPDATASQRYFLYSSFLFSLFGCLSAAKSVRDRQEGIPVSGLFYGLSITAAIVPLIMVGYNLAFESSAGEESHRGLIGMAYALSAFAVLAIAKNERDRQAANR